MIADAIVVAYRSSDVVRSCVAGLRADSAVDRIIVVNNSAGDDTEASISDVQGAVYIELPTNMGFGTAVNAARPHVKAPYVVLANPDTVPDSRTTSSLVSFMVAHPRCAVVGPRVVNQTGYLERTSQYDFTLTRMACQALKGPERHQLMRSRADHAREHRTECLIGAFLLCRVESLDEVDWFDESIFLFGEDQDLCRRLSASGWELWFSPVGYVKHLDGHSWRQLSDHGARLFREARYRELRKASGAVSAELYRVMAKTRDAMRRLRRL
jgi:GT2 family glycosyltransferase